MRQKCVSCGGVNSILGSNMWVDIAHLRQSLIENYCASQRWSQAAHFKHVFILVAFKCISGSRFSLFWGGQIRYLKNSIICLKMTFWMNSLSTRLEFLAPKLCSSLRSCFFKGHTMFENYPKCLIWVFRLWHFPPIFALLKLTCLVTLFDRKLQIFINSPNWQFFSIF